MQISPITLYLLTRFQCQELLGRAEEDRRLLAAARDEAPDDVRRQPRPPRPGRSSADAGAEAAD